MIFNEYSECENECYCLLFASKLNIINVIRKNMFEGADFMKTISIRLEDSIYEELGEMLDAMGQTKQTFYETFTRTALRERSIPFIISAPVSKKNAANDRKMEAFKRLEVSRKQSIEAFDYEKEREEAMNAKYGSID